MARRSGTSPLLYKQADHWLKVACACVLIVAGAWGAVYSARAARAQIHYKRAKYGLMVGTAFERPPMRESSDMLPLCEAAQRLYPHNYYFPLLVAWCALEDAVASEDYEQFRRLFAAASHWNRVAQAANPYDADATFVACRILQEKGGMAEAAELWRDVVLGREFWNPDNHETYAEFLLRAGQTTKALEESKWLRGGELQRDLRKLGQARARPDGREEPAP